MGSTLKTILKVITELVEKHGHYARGIGSLFVVLTTISLVLFIIKETWTNDKLKKSSKPLKVLVALYLSLCIVSTCKTISDFKYGDWKYATQDPFGTTICVIYDVVSGIVGVLFYAYWYAIKEQCVTGIYESSLRRKKEVFNMHNEKCIRSKYMHTILMLTAMICLTTDTFGYTVLVIGFVSIVFGLSSLSWLIRKSLQILETKTMQNDCSLQTKRYSKSQDNDLKLIRFIVRLKLITKMLVIISMITLIFTIVRLIPIFGENSIFRLIRNLWFTIGHLSVGGIYLLLLSGGICCRCCYKCMFCCSCITSEEKIEFEERKHDAQLSIKDLNYPTQISRVSDIEQAGIPTIEDIESKKRRQSEYVIPQTASTIASHDKPARFSIDSQLICELQQTSASHNYGIDIEGNVLRIVALPEENEEPSLRLSGIRRLQSTILEESCIEHSNSYEL